jgi:serine/threonine kinase
MEEKLKNSMRFYMLATQLKYKIRSGWDKSHWNVSKDRVESIAEHVYGTCILALSIDSEFKTNLDINKVIKMLVLHELGEVIIGDITPFDNITPEEKMKKEHEAMREVIGDLVNQEEFLSLLFEFDEKKTKEAIFAHHCDKLEADIQAKVYQDMGCQHPLDEQENNVVFKSNKVQQMVKDGAQTAFDIWYEWDKSLYYDDEDFARLLDYVRTINTQELLK